MVVGQAILFCGVFSGLNPGRSGIKTDFLRGDVGWVGGLPYAMEGRRRADEPGPDEES